MQRKGLYIKESTFREYTFIYKLSAWLLRGVDTQLIVNIC